MVMVVVWLTAFVLKLTAWMGVPTMKVGTTRFATHVTRRLNMAVSAPEPTVSRVMTELEASNVRAR